MTTPTVTTPTRAKADDANAIAKINAAAANASAHGHAHGQHVTWDEETIALHDKDRGTRMKIEEPKTPYHAYGADGDASPSFRLSGKDDAPPIEWSELQVKLAHVETKQQQREEAKKSKSEWDSSDDEGAASPAGVRLAARDAEGKKIEKDPEFSAKRKSHYNEFQAMKMWRQSHPDEDDEEEGDDDKAEGKVAKGEQA